MASLYDLFVSIQGDNSSFKKSIQESQDSLLGFGKQIEGVAGKIATAFTAAAITKFALDAGKALEEASNTIQRMTGAAGEKLDGLTDSFKHLYAGTSAGAESVAQAMSLISIRTGTAGAALESITAASLRFAKVTSQDVTSAVETNQRLFSQWSVSIEDQSAAMDMLLVASQKSAVSAAQLSQEMVSMGPVLRGFGLSFQESLGFIGSFAKAGLDATDMMRGLNKVLQEAAQTGQNPRDMLFDLIEKMKDAKTRADALNVAVGAGFGRSAATMVDGIRNGSVSLQDFMKWLGESEGAVKKTAERTTTLGGEITKLWHNIENGLSGTGKGFLEWMKDLVHQMNEVAKKGGMAALFGGGWAAGKILEANAWEISQGTTGKPEGNSLNTAPGGDGAPAPVMSEVTDKFHGKPFRDMSIDAALLMMAFDKDVASAKTLVEQVFALREAIKDLPQGPGWEGMILGNAPEIGGEDEATKRFVDDLLNTVPKLPPELQKLADAQQRVTDAFHFFGQETPRELELFAEAADKNFQIVRKEAGDDAQATRQAWEDAFRARVKYQLATGKITPHESSKILGELDEKGLNGFGKKIKDTERDVHQFFRSMSSGIVDAIKQWRGFADGISSVFKKMGEALFEIIFNRLMKPVEDFFADVITELFSKTATQAAATKAATSALNTATVASDAAVASAATFASIAAIPIVGPALAPAAAAASYAQVMAMAPLAMFEKGGDVPYDMPAFLHKKEMVLPADIATGMRKIIANGSGDGQARSTPPVQFVNCQFGQNSMNTVVRQLRLAGARI